MKSHMTQHASPVKSHMILINGKSLSMNLFTALTEARFYDALMFKQQHFHERERERNNQNLLCEVVLTEFQSCSRSRDVHMIIVCSAEIF